MKPFNSLHRVNLFYGNEFSHLLQDCYSLESGGIIFGYEVANPAQYGVVEFNKGKSSTIKNPGAGFVFILFAFFLFFTLFSTSLSFAGMWDGSC